MELPSVAGCWGIGTSTDHHAAYDAVSYRANDPPISGRTPVVGFSRHLGNNVVVKTEQVEQRGAEAIPTDASTRTLVLRSVLQHGPSTASQLAVRLELTPAAVRRHLTVLEQVGYLRARQQRVYGSRGRGRPAHAFELTDAGRAVFPASYDRLAIEALRALADEGGAAAVERFADAAAGEVVARFDEVRDDYPSAVEALVAALTDGGFVAGLRPVASGQQLCLHHCPVAHVAEVFPELCAAEARAFSRVLGTHVQQLATIAHGDGVCTTHVPRPVTPGDLKSSRKVTP
jgi:predicted ArsR family transcriptional regulator